jgi:hypothetical protein
MMLSLSFFVLGCLVGGWELELGQSRQNKNVTKLLPSHFRPPAVISGTFLRRHGALPRPISPYRQTLIVHTSPPHRAFRSFLAGKKT